MNLNLEKKFEIKTNYLSKIFGVVFLLFLLIMSTTNIFAYIPENGMKIFAVNSSHVAMDADLYIKIEEGSGKIYSSINSSVGGSTQESERNAVNITESLIDGIKDKYDYYFDIESSASSIDGPSAGAAMALLLISMHTNTDLSGKVSITGTITTDGSVGNVGGIYEKAKKASEVGIELFMIPAGNREQMIDEDGQVKLIDLVDYAYNNWNLKIVEVTNIEDVKMYAQMDIDDIDVNSIEQKKAPSFVPKSITYSRSLEPMRGVVDKYLIDANIIISSAESSVTGSIIKDSSITQNLLSFLNYSKDAIKDAQIYSSKNYLYTAANNSFIAQVYSVTVNEIVSNPSILKEDSTLFDIQLEDLEEKINLAENRSKLCSLDQLEWCVGARQRITWSRNKIDDLKVNKDSKDSLAKVLDFAYATAWCDIANDFLDIAVDGSGVKFVESSYFKDIAQERIVNIENELVIAGDEINADSDLLRRIKAAKYNFNKGWYVTSFYDSASALAVLNSRKESAAETFDSVNFYEKFNYLNESLRTKNSMNENSNIWSKLYLDHALFFENSARFYKDKSQLEFDDDLKTANSIVNIAYNLYDVEKVVLEYYNNADINSITTEVVDVKDDSSSIDSSSVNNNSQDVYVISNNNSKDNTLIYIFMVALFIIIIAIVVELEKYTNTKSRIQQQLSELDENLMYGKISEYTYKEMRHRYLMELNILNKKNRSNSEEFISIERKQKIDQMSKIHPSLIAYDRKINKKIPKKKSINSTIKKKVISTKKKSKVSKK